MLKLVIAAAFVLLLLGPARADAAQTRVFLEEFGSVEQPSFGEPDALAVDQETHEVYVVDADAQTVSRFHSDGTPSNFSALETNVIDAKGSGECPTVPADCDQTPENGFAFNGFTSVTQIAIDESGGLTDGNIYVTQGSKDLIDIFSDDGGYLGQLTAAGANPFEFPCGVAVGPSGEVFVGEWLPSNELHGFAPTADPPVNSDHTVSFPFQGGSLNGGPCSLAFGSGPISGFLVANIVQEEVAKLNPDTGVVVQTVDSRSKHQVGASNSAVAVDPVSGHVLVTGNQLPVREFDASGPSSVEIARFAGGEAIAVDGDLERVYVGGSGKVNVYSALVPIPESMTGPASILGLTSAKVTGTVNPGGVPINECRFEYGTTLSYGQIAPCAQSPAEIGAGKTAVAVHADLTGLAQETLYHYRLVAKNPNGSGAGKDRTFKTPSKPTIVGDWASNVVFTEATLKAKINPESSETTYRIEWGATPAYGNETGELSLGADDKAHVVNLYLDELSPGTTYHWRVVAKNEIGVREGADRTFITYRPIEPETDCPNQGFRTGPAAKLPDCRGYEMVSPLEKNNGDIVAQNSVSGYPGSVYQSATNGKGFTYSAGVAFGDSKSNPYAAQYIARRDAGDGWLSEAISPPRTRLGSEAGEVLDTEFKAFTSDLCSAWLLSEYEPVLAPGALPDHRNLYRRDNCDESGFEVMSMAEPLNASPGKYESRLQGISADGAHSIFVTNDSLSGTEAPDNPDLDMQLYEHTAEGELRFVCILPNGKPTKNACYAGTADSEMKSGADVRDGIFQNAISGDGSRIFWTEDFDGVHVGPGRIYLRTEGQKTIPVSQSVSGDRARFWGAAADGSRAIFGFEGSASPQKGNLYAFDSGTGKSSLIAGGVTGVLGIGEDAIRVYFASQEVLPDSGENSEGDEAQGGEPNVYLFEEGGTEDSVSFVATLANIDVNSHRSKPAAALPFFRLSRVTPDGRHAAFMSRSSLTGYDNTDAVSGEPAAEVFLYDSEEGRLRCVSCNPSGARPEGTNISARNRVLFGADMWAAAQFSGWERPLYPSRVLSDDGERIFFDSTDALLPRDTNGAQDVYQWEGAGSGDCDEADATFVADTEGCLSLISSGESAFPSTFLDADPSGDNVFISTLSSLVAQDYGLVDVYDVRVEGGFPVPTKPTDCEGEACQGLVSAPDDPTPASLTFNGYGNVPERGKARLRCPKGKARRKGRCAPRKQHRRAKRGRAKNRQRAGR